MTRMKDKVVVVTGSSTGIGQAASIKFAEEGADVVITYHSSRNGTEETLKAIEATGRKGLAVQTDVADVESIKNLIRMAYETFGHIDVLVNNAVVRNLALLHEVSDNLWNNSMETNLRSIFVATKEVAPIMMKQGGGSIINVSSMHGIRPSDNRRAGYASSKGGMIALTRSLATELSPNGIYVNGLILGSIPTGGSAATKVTATDANALHSAADAYETQFVPARRRGRLSESSECLIFLSNASEAFMTGESIVCDGGWTIID